MKKEQTRDKRGQILRSMIPGLLLFSFLLSGCSYRDNLYSYFKVLSPEKRTRQNMEMAEKFWSSVRPVSTLSSSHYKLGRYYQRKGKHEKAIREFFKALRNDRSFCKAYNGIAMSYDVLKNCEKAQNSYEQAIGCNPQLAYVYNNYACSNIICGDYEKAVALLLKAIELSEDNKRIRNNLQLAQAIVRQKTNLNRLSSEESNGIGTENEPIPTEKSVSRMPNIDQVVRPFLPKEYVSLDGGIKHFDSNFPMRNEKVVIIRDKAKKRIIRLQPQFLGALSNGAVEVSNGNGVTGMAGRSATFFRRYGFSIRRITNARHFHFDDSVIFHREGFLELAKELAKLIPEIKRIKKVESLGRSYLGVRILLGRDLVNVRFSDDFIREVSMTPDLEEELLMEQVIQDDMMPRPLYIADSKCEGCPDLQAH